MQRGPLRRRKKRPNKTAADLDAEMDVTRLRFLVVFFVYSHFYGI